MKCDRREKDWQLASGVDPSTGQARVPRRFSPLSSNRSRDDLFTTTDVCRERLGERGRG